MQYKLAAIDLDGTLTNSEKKVTKNTINAIIEAETKGLRIVLASGRPTNGIKDIAEMLELSRFGGYIAAFNGGLITSCKTNKTIYANHLSREQVEAVCNISKNFDVNVICYQDNSILTNDKENRYCKYDSFLNNLDLIETKDFLVDINKEVHKFLFAAEPSYAEKILPEVQKLLPDCSVYRSDPFYIEIMPKNVDKGTCLKELFSSLNLLPEETMAFGDGYNDLSMIKAVGMGVAMANSQEPVLKAADYITSSNNEDGVAKAIKHFIV